MRRPGLSAGSRAGSSTFLLGGSAGLAVSATATTAAVPLAATMAAAIAPILSALFMGVLLLPASTGRARRTFPWRLVRGDPGLQAHAAFDRHLQLHRRGVVVLPEE